MVARDPGDQGLSISEIGAVFVVGGAVAAGASQTDHFAPILAFAGALIVAVLTAVTTNRRQDHQLRAEERRQRAELAAGADRLERQLRSERRRQDVEHMRVLMDEVSAEWAHTIEGLQRLSVGALDPDADNDAEPIYDPARHYPQLLALAARLDLRLGHHHPLAARFHDAVVSLAPAMLRAIVAEKQDTDAIDKGVEQAGEHWRELTKEAV